MEDHFDISYELEKTLEARGKKEALALVQPISRMAQISYTRQKEAKGLGHAVLMARDMVGDEPFAVILPDDVIDADPPCLKQLIEVYNETGGSVIATQVIEGKAISAYGVLDVKPVPGKWEGRLFEVHDMVEKPKLEAAPSKLAIASTPPGALGELQLTEGIKQLLKKEKVYGFVFEGTRHDTGDKMGFLKANVAFALKREDIGDEFRQYLKSLMA
jgi:UTP--glucose-1-phosphate uridylyltransferase